jgi:hypothetical protein
MNMFVMGKHEKCLLSLARLRERTPRQGRMRGCLDMFQRLFRAQPLPPHPAFGHLGPARSASGAKGLTAVLRRKHRPSFLWHSSYNYLSTLRTSTGVHKNLKNKDFHIFPFYRTLLESTYSRDF